MNWKRKQRILNTPNRKRCRTVFLVTAEDLRRKKYIHYTQSLQIEVSETHRLGVGLGGALKDVRLDLRRCDLTGLVWII